MKRRVTCMIMAVVLVISLLPLGAISASAASALNYSENAVALIKQFEGFRATAYWDVNQWTIGYGTTGYAGQTISEYDADQALRSALNSINASINQFTARYNLNLNQYQHDALVSFSYNCGTQWITQGGRFFEAVTRGADVNTFLFAISLWANVGTTPDATLLNRRLAEANLYLNGVYSSTAPSAYTYVIFDPNGGTAGTNGEDKMQAYLSGSNVNILVGNPTKAGSSFGGWFTSPTGGTGVKYLSAATAGRTLYAQYGAPASITSGYCYVRNGAGSNYTQIGTVAAGSQIVIVETTQVNGVLWGRYIDGWVELSNTNYVGGGISGSTTGSTTTTTSVTTGTVVCNTGVNVRSGAGTNYPTVGSAYNGQIISIYETVNVNGTFWGRIGDNRWICLNYVKLNSTISGGTTSGTTSGTTGSITWEGTGTTTPAPGTTGTTNVTYSGTATASVNVRRGPGTGYAVCSGLKSGDRVTIYEVTTVNGVSWGRIATNMWVCLNYVKLNSTVSGGTTSGTTSGTTGSTGTVSGTVIATGTVRANTALNVRSGAGIAAPKVGTISGGTVVNIYEKVTVSGAEWGRIGNNQWVSMAYIVLNSTISSGSTTIPSTGTGTGTVISSTALNVRSGAGTAYTRISSLNPGTQVTIYEVVTNGTQQWGRIGTNQWVCMTYVRMNSTTSSGNTTGATSYVGTVTTNMNVRAAAGTNNAIVGRLTAGTNVTIYQLTMVNGVYWGRIANGWVCMNYIRLNSSNGVTWQ